MANKSLLVMTVAVFLHLAATAWGGAADRFKGGSYDGWDQESLLAAPPLWPGYNYPFKGGGYDGYASAGTSARIVWATLIRFY